MGELFNTFGENLATFLIPWIHKFNAECIIIGGNISNSFPLFKEALQKQFNSENVKIEIHISVLEEDAALIGSARLCDDNFYQKLLETKIIK